MANPVVFFDMAYGGAPMGRMVMELYADMCPVTAENFRALCTGEKGTGFFGKPLHYKGSIINYVNPERGFMVGGNIISNNNGLGESIYGANFKHEKSSKKHDRPGTLTMDSGVRGAKGLGSQFVICTKKYEQMDKYTSNCVFGQVVEGLDVVSAINKADFSTKTVTITDCGQIISTRVFFDIAIGGLEAGRMIIELFDDTNPKTARNFRALCTGEKGLGKVSGKPLHYKGSSFYRVIPGITCHGGDITDGDGTGLGESIYSPHKLEAENFLRKHTGPGILSMLSSGPGGCIGSQFFITSTKTEWLDRKHVAFGQVVDGMEVVSAIDKVGLANGGTTKPVTIVDCGQIYHQHIPKTQTTNDTDVEPY